MAGPTPISALIHAATMVAAGVYVVARLFPLFAAVADGAGRARRDGRDHACCSARSPRPRQDDIKRVLAWSTVSQIGYMTGALAVGAPRRGAVPPAHPRRVQGAAVPRAPASVIHAVGTNLMSRMGGLRRRMPVTFWSHDDRAGRAGRAAAAGRLLEQGGDPARRPRGTTPAGAAWLVYGAGAGSASRSPPGTPPGCWLRTFFGAAAPTPARARRTSPPAPMRWPVLVLAVPSALLGLAGLAPAFAERARSPRRARSTSGRELLLPLALAAARRRRWPGGCWRRAAGARPGRRRWAGCGPCFADAFCLDAVQDAPGRTAGAGAGPRGRARSTSPVWTARSRAPAGRRVGSARGLAAWHRAGLPRAVDRRARRRAAARRWPRS